MMIPLLIGMILAGQYIYDEIPITRNPDPAHRPQTHQEWLAGQPDYEPWSVSTLFQTSTAATPQILLIFEQALADSMPPALLEQWANDIAAQGLSTEVIAIAYVPPASLRAYLQNKYATGLEGAVLVGNLPVAWAAFENGGGLPDEEFPSDYYFMDLDGQWEDNWIGYPYQNNPGSDGLYDTWSGDLDPEIHVGRIKVDNIPGNPTDLLTAYLTRNHEWRTGGDPGPVVALCYVDDDWEPWAQDWRAAMQLLYPNTVLVSNPAATNGTDYRFNRLPANYVWISPFVHSYAHAHAWAPGPWTWWHHIVPANPQARFYNLFACSNARFTTPDNMGSVYVMNTSAGLAAVGSSKIGSMLHFTQFYGPLGDGASLGEAYMAWWQHIALGGLSHNEILWHLGMALIGDPTLIPAMHMLSIEEQDAANFGPAPALEIFIAGNPVSDHVAITATAAGGLVELFDISGRIVAAGVLEEGSSTLSVASLSPGMYVVRVRSEGVSATASFVILR